MMIGLVAWIWFFIYSLVHHWGIFLNFLYGLLAIQEWLEIKSDNIKYRYANQNKWYSNERPFIIEKLLATLFSVRTILQDGKLYLRRIYLSPRWKILPRYIFLHHILLSDTDLAKHDHPADFISIILKGRYVEHTADGKSKEYGPGSILINKAEKIHRLDIVKPVWSLIIWSKAKREWGFWPDNKFVPWYEFLNKNKYENNYPEDIIR